MAIQSAAGAQLNVAATAPATYDAAGYAALTYTTVGEVQNIGEFGKEFALITFTALADRGTRKLKGSFNNGTLNPQIALDPDDAGQVLMEAAAEDDAPVAVEVVLQDGTAYHFMALVMSFRPNVGEVDSVVMASCSMEVTEKERIKVAA